MASSTGYGGAGSQQVSRADPGLFESFIGSFERANNTLESRIDTLVSICERLGLPHPDAAPATPEPPRPDYGPGAVGSMRSNFDRYERLLNNLTYVADRLQRL